MTTLREAALALVNDTLLERTVDTKRLSAVGRDLEDALDAEPAQPVAWLYEYDGCKDRGIVTDVRWASCQEPWSETPLYAAPQPPADVPKLTDEECTRILTSAGLTGPLWMSVDSGPHEVIRASFLGCRVVRAIAAEVRRGCGVVE